jgi:hypothetical protein
MRRKLAQRADCVCKGGIGRASAAVTPREIGDTNAPHIAGPIENADILRHS